MQEWLARLRHDLVRPFVWRARDVREDDSGLDDAAKHALLMAVLRELYDGEGQPITALELWAEIAGAAPPVLTDEARAPFDAALARVVEVLPRRTAPLDEKYAAIAALDAAFGALGRTR